jgi:hypothetical protein
MKDDGLIKFNNNDCELAAHGFANPERSRACCDGALWRCKACVAL